MYLFSILHLHNWGHTNFCVVTDDYNSRSTRTHFRHQKEILDNFHPLDIVAAAARSFKGPLNNPKGAKIVKRMKEEPDLAPEIDEYLGKNQSKLSDVDAAAMLLGNYHYNKWFAGHVTY